MSSNECAGLQTQYDVFSLDKAETLALLHGCGFSYEELKKTEEGESSGEIRLRVERARAIQNERYAGTKIRVNARLGVKELPIYCKLGEKEEQLMEQAFHRLHLTARTYHRILKVSRTIADMEGVDRIRTKHIKEALGYRTLEKKYWGR